MFGQGPDDEDDSTLDSDLSTNGAPLSDLVLERLSYEFASFAEVAETLEAIPWDVLKVCRELVKRGLVEEGKGERRGSFRRKGA
jgi:hypothetical protein